MGEGRYRGSPCTPEREGLGFSTPIRIPPSSSYPPNCGWHPASRFGIVMGERNANAAKGQPMAWCEREYFLKGLDLQTAPDHWARLKPRHPAFIDAERRLTYADFAKLVSRCASGLRAAGLEQGDIVVVMLPNWHEAPIVLFAAARVGATLVFCDEVMEEGDLALRLERVDPAFVVLARADLADAARAHAPRARIVTVRFDAPGCTTFADLLAGDADTCEPAPVDVMEDPFVIAFTSGSTGLAKGVVLSQESSLFSWRGYGRAMQCTSDDVFAVPIPLSHMFGVNMGIVLPVMFGATAVLVEKFAPHDLLRTIERERVSVIYGVPTVFGRLLLDLKKHPVDLSSVRTGLVGSATVAKELVEDVWERLHCRVVVGYGSTEAVAVTCTTVEDDLAHTASTVGRPFPGVEVRLLGDDGVLRERGEGELVVRSPCMMRCYWHDPARTAEAYVEGWLRTGDAASLDDEGYARILGRIDGMIIRGGFNVYAAELEHLYSAHPAVLEAAAFPLPHPELGQQIVLALTCKRGTVMDQAAFRQWAEGRIAKFKLPDRIVFFHQLPQLPTGKIDVQALKQAVQRP